MGTPGRVAQTRYCSGPKMDNVTILIIDEDKANQSALQQVLDSEGWQVRIAASTDEAFQQLAGGRWSLVIGNTSIIGLSGTLFEMLAELAHAPPLESGKARLRVLFLVSESGGSEARGLLEAKRLPYVVKPFHFHDFLEKVSDLLLETEAISQPIRRVRLEAQAGGRRQERGTARHSASSHISAHGTRQPAGRNTGMFANRDYYEMTEEEITDYERQEAEEQRQKKKKKPEDLRN
jgi:DNA-binding response OmpR family regulator